MVYTTLYNLFMVIRGMVYYCFAMFCPHYHYLKIIFPKLLRPYTSQAFWHLFQLPRTTSPELPPVETYSTGSLTNIQVSRWNPSEPPATDPPRRRRNRPQLLRPIAFPTSPPGGSEPRSRSVPLGMPTFGISFIISATLITTSAFQAFPSFISASWLSVFLGICSKCNSFAVQHIDRHSFRKMWVWNILRYYMWQIR